MGICQPKKRLIRNTCTLGGGESTVYIQHYLQRSVNFHFKAREHISSANELRKKALQFEFDARLFKGTGATKIL